MLGLVIASLLVGSSPAVAAPWTPEPAAYAIAKQTNVPVSMADGTVLRADVYSPTDPHTGQAASGPFPVIMVQTPYGKDTVGAGSGQQGGAEAGSETGEVPYLIQRGYIDVVAEVRGTGDSQGTFNLLDPVQGQDGATLVKWAAGLAHSNGRVGLYGPSYMGLNQFLTADHLGPGSPVKALFPIVAGTTPTATSPSAVVFPTASSTSPRRPRSSARWRRSIPSPRPQASTTSSRWRKTMCPRWPATTWPRR